MRIRLVHPRYQALVKTDEALTLQGESVVVLYPDAVAECTVTISRDTIHTAALSKQNTILHWYGNGSTQFQYQEIAMENQPIRGLRLITDSSGTPCLFYLQQSPRPTVWTLIQHSFAANEWSDPMRVTGNISSSPGQWQICFGSDQSLHLVYLSQEQDTLFYRVADMKTRTWTGAVPIAREYAEHPQVYASGSELVAFWISHLDQGKVLRAVVRHVAWSKPYDLSPISKDIFQPGIVLDQGRFGIMWMQSGKLWYTSYDRNWSPAEQLELDQCQSGYQTVLSGESHNYGCAVLRVYNQKHADPAPREIVPPAEPEIAKKAPDQAQVDQTRKEAERRFFTEAFQLHLEWQSLKEQYTKVLEEQGRLAEAVEARLADRLQELAAAEYAKQAEKIELLSQRVLAVREDVRNLRERTGLSQKQTEESPRLKALKQRVDQLEAGLRAKASVSQLQEVKTRVARLEQAINPPAAFQSKTKEAEVKGKEQPEKGKKRTIWQRILSRL